MPLFTIGHSNITQEEFTRLLEAATIKIIADVRTRPYSGNNPQFNQQSLEAALVAKGIKYIHFPQLGGSPTGNEPGIFHHMKTTEGVGSLWLVVLRAHAQRVSPGSGGDRVIMRTVENGQRVRDVLRSRLD
eukprot:GEMP01099231.1.p2 GENE.GEMP01099231.1~~GEMP01099231.1.p2  ORF type:complete len:131 (+),score=17.48 GEMP01099231.1:147-539(+)